MQNYQYHIRYCKAYFIFHFKSQIETSTKGTFCYCKIMYCLSFCNSFVLRLPVSAKCMKIMHCEQYLKSRILRCMCSENRKYDVEEKNK